MAPCFCAATKEPDVTSVITVQEICTAGSSQVLRGLTAAYFGKHSSEMHNFVYTILEGLADYEADFDFEAVSSKRPTSFPTRSLRKLQSGILNTLVNEGNSSGHAGRSF